MSVIFIVIAITVASYFIILYSKQDTDVEPLQLAQIYCGVNAPNFDDVVFLETVIFQEHILWNWQDRDLLIYK